MSCLTPAAQLREAATEGNVDVVKALLEAAAVDVNVSFEVSLIVGPVSHGFVNLFSLSIFSTQEEVSNSCPIS